MPSKLRYLCMDKDDIVWQKLEEATDEWEKSLQSTEMYRAVGNVILKYKDGQADLMHPLIRGGYNVVYRLEYKDGSSVIMRIPIKGVVAFPEEKIRYEVATMRYVAAHTTIPVPHVYHYGMAAENPTGLGPFIIMDYIEHHQNMSRELLDPTLPINKHPILDPNISEEKLEMLYGQMANILLQLSSLKFPRIGSLVEKKGDNSISVEGRPLTANMNDIVIHTNAPTSVLSCQTYASADEWYSALADMHMAQLTFQHSDAVDDEDDAHDKYTARQLFRKLATEKRLISDSPTAEGEFRLFSEDLRPANVLLDKELRVVGVIDWEFAYAAPAQFSYDPPWWLLLEEPESWKEGYRGWMETYEPRLQIFLRVLEAEEKKFAVANLAEGVSSLSLTGDAKTEPPLSQRMRESWEKKTWMVKYAARKSWAFDFIWWKFLDENYLGPNEDQDHKARLGHLSEAQREVMEAFVTQKMEERTNEKLLTLSDEDLRDDLAKFLV
ncbi:phosphotransferase family protein [Hypoxylon sp. FL1857]|nr:phosphotransferase family protein [Hypoxylon sp. FL1857]